MPSPEQSIRFADYYNDYHCERATELRQFESAFQTIHACYQQRGYIASNSTKLWMTRHHLIPTARVFITNSGAQSQGTLTLIEDGPLGLPMESLFRDEVAQRRKQYGPLAEATCLALDLGSTTSGPRVVDRLMGVVAQAARWSGVTQIAITVHPRHATYYTRKAGFSPIGPPRPYPAVRGNLAVPLALHLPTLSKFCPAGHRRYFGMRFPTSLLARSPIPSTTSLKLTHLWQSIQNSTEILEAAVDRRAA